MIEDPRPPVAIRVTRPQATEDEFLEQELETLTRTSATLIGAQPRPQGVVLRFEIVLSSGQVVVRGEGRVVGFRPNAYQGLGGLTMRFTRLDSRTKSLIDKAAALRERRRLTMGPPPSEPIPTLPPPPPSSAPPPATPSPDRAPVPPAEPSALSFSDEPAPTPHPHHLAPLAGRDALLARLRSRAKTLDPAAVQRILRSRRNA